MTNDSHQTGTRRVSHGLCKLGAIVFLGVAVFGTYSKAPDCEFLSYDDKIHIVQNPWLNPPTYESVGRFWRGPYWGEYVPLTYSLWAWEALVGQRDAEGTLSPWLFHFVNVALHALATVTVFLFIKEVTSDTGPAILAALLFGLHPLQVEPVVWVSETRGLLSGLFGILALWTYLRFARSVPSNGRRAVAWYAVATSAFALALLAKSSAVAVVPMVAVIDVMLLKRRAGLTFVALLPWTIAALAMAAIMTSQQGTGSIAYRPMMIERIAMSGDAVAFYLGKLLWPAQLCVDYGWNPLFMREQWWFYALPSVTVALFVVAWLLRRRSSLLLGLLVFVAALSPVLGLIPFTFQDMSLVADRFVYLAMLGPAIVLAMSTRRLSKKWMVALAMVLVLVLPARSWWQTLAWNNDFTLAVHARQVNRSSIFAAATLAQVMMHKGEREGAHQLCLEAVRLNPHSARAWINLAQIYTFYGQSDAAVHALHEALLLHPTSSLAHRMLAESMEKKDQLEEAIEHYRQAMKYGRRDADRSVLQVRIGSALLRLKRDQEAVEAFESAVHNLPRVTSDVWIALAQAHTRTGKSEAALEALGNAETALSQTTNDRPAILVAIAQSYADVGHFDDALRLANQAVEGYRRNDDPQGILKVEQWIESWQATSESK